MNTVLKWIYGNGPRQGCPNCPIITIFIAFIFTAIGYGLSFFASKRMIPALYDLFGALLFILGFTVGLIFAVIACIGTKAYVPTQIHDTLIYHPGRRRRRYESTGSNAHLVEDLDPSDLPLVGPDSLLYKSDEPLENMDTDDRCRDLSSSDEQKRPQESPPTSKSSSFNIISGTGSKYLGYGMFHQCNEESSTNNGSASNDSASKLVAAGFQNKGDAKQAVHMTQADSAAGDVLPNQNDEDDNVFAKDLQETAILRKESK